MISVFQSCSLCTHPKKKFTTKASSVSIQRYAETQENHERPSTNNDCRKKHSLSLDVNRKHVVLVATGNHFATIRTAKLTIGYIMEKSALRTANKWN